MRKCTIPSLALLCGLFLCQAAAHAEDVSIIMDGTSGQFYTLPESGQGEVIYYPADPSLFACPAGQVCFFHQPDTIDGHVPDFDTFAFGPTTYTDDGTTYFTDAPFITVTGNDYTLLPGDYTLSATLDGPTIGSLDVVAPEPSSLMLLGTGVLALAGAVRRRARSV